MSGVPARLAGVDPDALAAALARAGGDWSRVVARGQGAAVTAERRMHRVELPPAVPHQARRRGVVRFSLPGDPGWALSPRAALALAGQAFTLAQAVAALTDPQADRPDVERAGRRVAERDGVRVLYDRGGRLVVAVTVGGPPAP